PMLLAAGDEEESHAEVKLDGKKLQITPKSEGSHYFTLMAQSNGRTVTKTAHVKVGITTGIDNTAVASKSIDCDGQRLYITGFNGEIITVYTIDGQTLTSFGVDEDNYIFDFGGHTGMYILKSESNYSTKVIIR
ncbi:MAG: T9SS type A sorting domain-containing protein, partial [Muribaculaceae bacterium]|nr:T9SS type A sorting domain-containing protein [Muribaculaceae bacterium]